jgi:hypothetical protein
MADRRKELAEAKKKLQSQLRSIREIEKRQGGNASGYDAHKERAAAHGRAVSAAGREIGDIPAVKDAARNEKCRLSFRVFCETYGPDAFPLAWSKDHLTAIDKIEAAVLRGELFAFAMPRGSGKTTLSEWACLWALLYGHRPFVMLVGADQAISCSMLESIKSHLAQNDLLLEDFPAACYPIRALDGISARARGQTCGGVSTSLDWTADQITLPWIPGAPSAGAAVRVAGITGRIRGVKHTRPDGATVRPSLVLIDDCQTDESAASPAQVATREKILSGAILGLAGPGSKIAGLCTITVIRPDDLADRLLDRNRSPAWQGERTQLVYEWPEAEELWSQYAETRRQGQRDGSGTGAADAFYLEHRDAMDKGSRVAWPERKNEDELSAIQHAWNLRIDRGESAFFAEYQNQPMADDISSEKLDRKALAMRALKIPRLTVPLGHNTVTAFIDVQEKLLYWLVTSWNQSFGGSVIAYGTYPDQAASVFEAQTARKTLANVSKMGFEAALRAGLDKTVEILMGREWKREDGTAMRIDRLMVDANWGRSTSTVRTFVRQSPFSSTLYPSHGKGIGASSQPLAEKGARGDRLGLNWRIGQMSAGQRSCTYDTNYWKSFVAARLRMGIGDPEAITFHEGHHDLLIQHLTSEFPVRTEARGRVVDEWKSAGRENHWFDCLVGSAVAASITGLQPTATEAGTRARRKVALPTGEGGRKVITVKRLR